MLTPADVTITLKAKTTCKRTRAVKKKKLSFSPTLTGHTIGSASSCDFVLDDSNLAPVHARIELMPDGSLHLRSTGRTYYLIGQGVQSTGPHMLERDQVVKMGACSLQITDTCVEARNITDDDMKKYGRDMSDDDKCYICFEDTSEPGNELVPSPCSCGKPVHRQCLSRWISTKGSRLCSICKSKLPIDFTVDAPFVVLQVVRHMRGLHWAGEREYVLSFNCRPSNSVTVGSGTDCDLCLPDPSLSRTHSRIEFRDGAFYVEDLTSSAGTFLKLNDSHPLSLEQVSMYKLGRTMLTVKVEIRRGGMLRSWRARKAKSSPSPSPQADGSVASLAGLLSPTSISTPVHVGGTPANAGAGGLARVGATSPVAAAATADIFGAGTPEPPLEDFVDDADAVLPLDGPTDGIEGITTVEDYVEEADEPNLLSPLSAAASP